MKQINKCSDLRYYRIEYNSLRECHTFCNLPAIWGGLYLKSVFFFKFINVDVPWVYRQLHAVFTCDTSPNLKWGVTHRISMNSSTTHIFFTPCSQLFAASQKTLFHRQRTRWIRGFVRTMITMFHDRGYLRSFLSRF